MAPRIQLVSVVPELLKQLIELNRAIEKAAADAGVDRALMELLKIRTSQLNGCAYCLNMHARDARKNAETERRIYLLNAWRDATDDYSEQERAAFALAEAMTKLSETQDVPDDVYNEAVRVFTEEQFNAVAWGIAVMNTFNRINVTSHLPVPK